MSPPETSEKIETVSPKAVSTGIGEHPVPGKENLHLVERSGNNEGLVQYDDSDSISGFNAALMGARVTLSNVEEKKLVRRIDWRLIPLMSLMYMLKSVDYSNVCLHSWLLEGIYLLCDQVSNARVMDKGTPHNIITELHMTANEYNLVTTMYYVWPFLRRQREYY